MENEQKKMSLKEFREKGYLQELNRSILHPLGLAMSLKVNEDGEEEFDGILDFRDKEGGVYFGINLSDDVERKKRFKKNEKFIIDELQRRMQEREEKLGFFIEPIN